MDFTLLSYHFLHAHTKHRKSIVQKLNEHEQQASFVGCIVNPTNFNPILNHSSIQPFELHVLSKEPTDLDYLIGVERSGVLELLGGWLTFEFVEFWISEEFAG